MLFFGRKKRAAAARKENQSAAPQGGMPKGLCLVQDIRHSNRGVWHQYDVLLATRGYGWTDMVDWAEYFRSTDLYRFSTLVTTETPGGRETEHKDEYQQHLGSLKALPSLAREQASLGIGGSSRMLGCPMKVVWFNQTRTLRLLTMESDQDRVRAFADALIQKRFGAQAR